MKMRAFFKKLFVILDDHDKHFLYALLALSIVVSTLETVGIALIMPYISLATNFELISTNSYYAKVYELFSFKTPIDFVLFISLLLVIFYILRSLLNIFYFYMLSKFSKGRYHHIARKVFKNYLQRDYQSYVNSNSAEIMKIIVTEVQHITSLISSFLLMLSEIFIIIFIYALMLYINLEITLMFSLVLGLNIIILVKSISVKIKEEGKIKEVHQKKFFKIINETFQNFKLIKLNSNNQKVMNRFEDSSLGYVHSFIKSETYSHIPRLYLEALSFIIVILIIAFYIYQNQSDASAAFAIISMFVLGLYRLMPSAHRILNAYNLIQYHYNALDIVHDALTKSTENLGHKSIDFRNDIELKGLSFEYDKDKVVLQDINLIIQKGESIAFVGESGSGKSTIVDIIMGLYKPTKGEIAIDQTVLSDENIVSWRERMGYIPQSIYLFDGTVSENVAFNYEMDTQRVKDVLKQANLLQYLESNHQGIETQVGENGIKLSGGQRQRIAIARALYNNPEILVLDEATSALDEETERVIMQEIYAVSKERTLIIIAHRLSTLTHCDRIYKIQNRSLELQEEYAHD